MTIRNTLSVRSVLLIFFVLSCARSCDNSTDRPVWKTKIDNFSQLQDNFQDPPMWYAPHTFWFWDAPVDADQTTEMARQMSQQRLNPGYTHARKGLPKEEWLSEKWFDAFGKALEEAKKEGLTLGYNDEYWWPSGQAAGRVLEENPGLNAKSLKFRKISVEGETVIDLPESKFTVAARVDSNDLILSGTLEVIGEGTSFQWNVPGGKWVIYVYETFHHAGIDGGEVNYLDPALMDAFIPLAHESYLAKFKKDMGSSIPGVFVDNEGDFGWKMAWSEFLPVRYKEMKNRDIRSWMPLLTDEDEEGLWAKARYDWFDVVSDIYCTQFLGRLSNWLEERDMYYITNLWEESLMLITQAVGDLMRAQRAVTLPGNDAIDMRSQSVHDFKETQSVCEFEDRPFMCEIMGVRGWSQTPEEMKRTVNLVTAWGVNHIVAHGIYNNRDLTSIPYPADWYTENPYFEYLDLWTDFARRASYVNRQGRLVADVLLINPLESAWALSASYFSEAGLGSGEGEMSAYLYHGWDAKVIDINRTYSNAMEVLTESNIDYLIADRHYMEQAQIDEPGSRTEDQTGGIKIGNHSFSAIVLPPAFLISRTTAAKILEFAREGGTVVLLGDLPVGSPEMGAEDKLIQEQMLELLDCPGVIILAGSEEPVNRLPGALQESIPVQFRNLSGELDLVFSHRVIDDNDFYWIVNRSDTTGVCKLNLREGRGRAEIWDCETGKMTPVAYENHTSGNLVELKFHPYQAYWLVFNSNETPIGEAATTQTASEIVLDNHSWNLSLPENESVKVSTAQIMISQIEKVDGDFMEVSEDAWAWQKILGEVKITEPWNADMYFIPEPTTTFYYRYGFTIDDTPELGFLNISGDDIVTLWVNGNELEQGANSRIWYKTDSYSIGGQLLKGENTIAVEVVNTGGPGSFMLQGRYKTVTGETGLIRTGPGWKESRSEQEGWFDPEFDDKDWETPNLASDEIYKSRIELFDNPKKSIGPYEYVWWRINVPPGAHQAVLHGISDQSLAWSNNEQVEIRDSQVDLPEGSGRIYIRLDPRQNPEFLASPVEFQCKGESPGNIGSWFDYGLHRFTGYVDYEATFAVQNRKSKVRLDLGSILYMAEVWINGENAGSRLWRPFEYDISDFVKEGENHIRIRVGNLVHNEMSLINDVEESITMWGKTGIPLLKDLDAGLFGPVRIVMND